MSANLREFAGCEYTIQAEGSPEERREKLAKVVAALMDHPHHDHNFAVALDGSRVYMSRLAVECLQLRNILPHVIDLDAFLPFRGGE